MFIPNVNLPHATPHLKLFSRIISRSIYYELLSSRSFSQFRSALFYSRGCVYQHSSLPSHLSSWPSCACVSTSSHDTSKHLIVFIPSYVRKSPPITFRRRCSLPKRFRTQCVRISFAYLKLICVFFKFSVFPSNLWPQTLYLSGVKIQDGHWV